MTLRTSFLAWFLTIAAAYAGDVPAPMPHIVSRAEWGARPPQCSMPYCTPWEHVTIHHSASSSDYDAETLEDCKALVRSMQAHHMDANGWCDIGYNFLVCKHGNIFEGRDDSLNYRRGQHDGIDCPGLGIAALGYFHPPFSQQPTSEMIQSIESLIAWQWDALGRSPYGTGLYGEIVENIIGGHRDVAADACPGDELYALVGADFNSGAIRDGVCSKMGSCVAPFRGTLNVSQIQIKPSGAEKVQVQGSFSLGSESDGIDPTTQVVLLSLTRLRERHAYPTSEFPYTGISNGFDTTAGGWSISQPGKDQSGVQAFEITRTNDSRTFTFNFVDAQSGLESSDYSQVTVRVSIGNDTAALTLSLVSQGDNWTLP